MSRADEETQELGDRHACRTYMQSALTELDTKIASIIRSIEEPAAGSSWGSGQLAEALSDTELVTLDTWSGGTSDIIHAEVSRRAGHYRQQAQLLGDLSAETVAINRLPPRSS